MTPWRVEKRTIVGEAWTISASIGFWSACPSGSQHAARVTLRRRTPPKSSTNAVIHGVSPRFSWICIMRFLASSTSSKARSSGSGASQSASGSSSGHLSESRILLALETKGEYRFALNTLSGNADERLWFSEGEEAQSVMRSLEELARRSHSLLEIYPCAALLRREKCSSTRL